MGVVTRTRIKARNVRIDSLLCEARLPGPRNPQYPASVKTVRRLDAKCVNYADTLDRPESVGIRSDTVLLQERQNLVMPMACDLWRRRPGSASCSAALRIDVRPHREFVAVRIDKMESAATRK